MTMGSDVLACSDSESHESRECIFERSFIALYRADLASDAAALLHALRDLTMLLDSAQDGWPAWLDGGGILPCDFCRIELLCRGSPQDFLRCLWRRQRDKDAPSEVLEALGRLAESLVGEEDPWALAAPRAVTYRLPRPADARGGELLLHMHEADYLTSGSGRFVYGAAECLSRRLIDRWGGIDVCGRNVLELGCGLGLAGLACAGAGAAAVTMTDVDAAVLEACQKNIMRNSAEGGGMLPASCRLRCLMLDWRRVEEALPALLCNGEPGASATIPFDIVLAADVCYDPEHPLLLLQALRKLGESGALADGVEVLVLNGWPNRGLSRFERILDVSDSTHSIDGKPATSDVEACPLEESVILHDRKFLEIEDEEQKPADMSCVADLGGVTFSSMHEFMDGTDERGAPARMRLYQLTWSACHAAEPNGRDAIGSQFASWHIRARAISLRRCAGRWSSCEAHMRDALPSWMDFQMSEGLDGSLYKPLLGCETSDELQAGEVHVPSDQQVKAVEAAMGCHLYRGWPVCETEDVLRVLAEVADDGATTCMTDAQAWDAYRRWFADWSRERSWPYIDFHCRHITLGEIGAALAHIQLIQKAHRDGVQLHLFFEDDARPRREAVPRLLEEIALLERSNFEWDLIYLRASLYSKTPEEPLADLVPGSRLFHARHRKVTDAYCLSQRGLARIADSGFSDCLFAFDDFLPSLHSEHPRRDVMKLPCVIRARCDADGGFVGLSFGDEVLSDSARSGSETNLSPCVIGDHGSELG